MKPFTWNKQNKLNLTVFKFYYFESNSLFFCVNKSYNTLSQEVRDFFFERRFAFILDCVLFSHTIFFFLSNILTKKFISVWFVHLNIIYLCTWHAVMKRVYFHFNRFFWYKSFGISQIMWLLWSQEKKYAIYFRLKYGECLYLNKKLLSEFQNYFST